MNFSLAKPDPYPLPSYNKVANFPRLYHHHPELSISFPSTSLRQPSLAIILLLKKLNLVAKSSGLRALAVVLDHQRQVHA